MDTITRPDADSHDAVAVMREALIEARVQVEELQRRLGIVDTGHGTLSIIDRALARSEERADA